MGVIETADAANVMVFLLEVTLKGTLVLAAAGLATALLRSASAAVRHLVWSTALILLLVLPAFVAFAPSYDVAVLPPEIDAFSSAELPNPTVAPNRSDRSIRAVRRLTSPAVDEPRDTSPRQLARDRQEATGPAPAARSGSRTAASIDWRIALLVLWTFGAALVGLRYALGWAALKRIRRHTVPVADVGLRLLVKRTAAGIGLHRRVRIEWGKTGSMPLTFGWIRPTLLLPEDAREWAPERLVVVLQHELAHVKRWDCLIQAVVYVACTFYWFNPLVWLAASKSHREREMACDDYVLSMGAPAPAYAGHLLEIARALHRPALSGVTTIAMARRTELEGRLMAILNVDRKREKATARGMLTTIAVLMCLVMTVGALRPVAMPAEEAVDTTAPSLAVPLDGATRIQESTVQRPSKERRVLSVSARSAEVVEEQGGFEATATVVGNAAALLETSLHGILPREIRLNGSLTGKISGAIDLFVEGGLEIVSADTIPLEQIVRLRNAGVEVAFVEAMASVGFDHLTIDQLISLAHADVDIEYVRGLREAGFDDLNADDLITLGFAGVDIDDIQVWAELGYQDLSSQELIALAHAGVEAEDVKALAEAGYDGLSPDELVGLSHAGVDSDFIRAMHEIGLDDLSTQDLVRLSHADVDAEFIRKMREAGYDGLDAGELIRLSHADVDPSFIRRMSEMGLSNLSTDDLVKLGHADVDIDFVAEMQSAGYDHLAVNDLVALSHADVDAAFVREMGKIGLTSLSVPDLIKLGHADIDASFVREMKESGYNNLQLDELIQLGYADVDPDYIASLAKAGLTGLAAMDLVQLSHADIDAEALADLTRAGLKDLSTTDLIKLGYMDVDGGYISDLQSVGLTGLSVEDILLLAGADVEAGDIRRLQEMGVKTKDPALIVQFKYMDLDADYVERMRRALDSEQ